VLVVQSYFYIRIIKSLKYKNGEKNLFANHVRKAREAQNRAVLYFLQQVQGLARPSVDEIMIER